MTIINEDRATAPLFMKARNFLIRILAGKRSVILNIELSISPRKAELPLTIHGDGGLFCNIKMDDLNGMAVRLDQWSGK